MAVAHTNRQNVVVAGALHPEYAQVLQTYSQAQNYETFRAMYEAFNANKLDATGEIAWMLNTAWPSFYGHLYDYELRAGGAYFGTKLGCEPVHALYRYDDRAVVVTSDKVYADEPVAGGYTEAARLGGADPYAGSKACVELVVETFRQAYFGERGLRLSSAPRWRSLPTGSLCLPS